MLAGPLVSDPRRARTAPVAINQIPIVAQSSSGEKKKRTLPTFNTLGTSATATAGAGAGAGGSGVASVIVWVVTTPDAAALVTVVVIVGIL